jgi:hypothetical protein
MQSLWASSRNIAQCCTARQRLNEPLGFAHCGTYALLHFTFVIVTGRNTLKTFNLSLSLFQALEDDDEDDDDDEDYDDEDDDDDDDDYTEGDSTARSSAAPTPRRR